MSTYVTLKPNDAIRENEVKLEVDDGNISDNDNDMPEIEDEKIMPL
jgi:hypothetical protein